MHWKLPLTAVILAAATMYGVYCLFDDTADTVATKREPQLFSFIQRPREGDLPAPEQIKINNNAKVEQDIASLKKLFDYHLATASGKPVTDIRQSIEQETAATLAPAHVGRTRELLGRYLEYTAALAALRRGEASTVAAMETDMHAVRQLRARYFNDMESEGMFAADDAAAHHELARLRIVQDPSLSQETKEARLLALEATVSQQLQQAREERNGVITLRHIAAPLASPDSADDGVYRITAVGVSADGANPGTGQ